ncbi:MAG: hypothetical protein ACRBN8_26080 [Nannocystales bacterium]
MTRDLACLLPLLLLACDADPASSTDTDEGSTGSTSSDADPTDAPTDDDPTGADTTGADTTGADTTGADTTGGDTTGADTTGADTTGADTTGDETTGDETTGDETTGDDTTGADPVCGDGQVDGDELCDDGDDNGSYGFCAAGCEAQGAYCGDGNTDAEFEACDDGDAVNGNGCNIDCVVSGATLWEVTETSIGAKSDDIGYSIAALDDGSIRVGRRSEPTEFTQQLLLTDYTLDGSPLGEEVHINSAPNSVDLGVQSIDPSGGYLLSWISTSFTTNPDDVFAYSGDHFIDWSVEAIDATDVVRRPDGGGIYLHRDNSLDPTQWFVVDNTGTQTHFSPSNLAIYDGGVLAAGDDSVIVIGAVDVGAGLEATLSRFTATGTLEYRTFYDLPPSGDLSQWVESSVAINGAEQFVAANTTSGSADNQVLISSFNTDGSLAWDTLYDHPGDDTVIVRATAIDSEGNVFIVGSLRSGPVLDWDFDGLIVKYDSAGTRLWAQTYAGDADQGADTVQDVTVLEDNSIAITGALTGPSGTRDAWVARIAP